MAKEKKKVRIPIQDRILVKMNLEEERVTEGGVILPATKDASITQAATGIVKFVGKGAPGVPNECKVGDMVFFLPVLAVEVMFDDDTYMVLRECDILLTERDV